MLTVATHKMKDLNKIQFITNKLLQIIRNIKTFKILIIYFIIIIFSSCKSNNNKINSNKNPFIIVEKDISYFLDTNYRFNPDLLKGKWKESYTWFETSTNKWDKCKPIKEYNLFRFYGENLFQKSDISVDTIIKYNLEKYYFNNDTTKIYFYDNKEMREKTHINNKTNTGDTIFIEERVENIYLLNDTILRISSNIFNWEGKQMIEFKKVN